MMAKCSLIPPGFFAIDSAKAEEIFAATYPLIHAHLKAFEQPLRAPS